MQLNLRIREMQLGAIIFMIVILTLMWGGFLFSLKSAIKKEAIKSSSE